MRANLHHQLLFINPRSSPRSHLLPRDPAIDATATPARTVRFPGKSIKDPRAQPLSLFLSLIYILATPLRSLAPSSLVPPRLLLSPAHGVDVHVRPVIPGRTHTHRCCVWIRVRGRGARCCSIQNTRCASRGSFLFFSLSLSQREREARFKREKRV